MDEPIGPRSLAIILTFELIEIAFDHLYVVRDTYQQVLCKLRSSDSRFQAQWEFMDADDSTKLTLTKKLVSIHDTWTAYNSNGDEQFSLKKNHIFPKQTNIHVCSETKIAQMRALDNAEGFMVEVIGNVRWELVAACFAVVVAMKSEARKRKEFVRHVPDITAKFLGGVAIGAGKAMFDLISGAS
ncbi:hypothetical protein QVD17_18585 [Tagetes erecta]|uniref:Uncharacterized protein n=1 Tax=Tagetes erecta TaxID=13708 RepID=A0AAD8NW82_TARER|nr:hypothetical protein QVD17_18585 [Tagetes erecta]